LKNLIAVLSCWRNEEAVQVIRETWAKDSPVEVKFFYGGQRRELLNDEVALDVPDTYATFAQKVKAMMVWALTNGYTHVLKADDDVYVVPSRVRFSGDHAGFLTPQGYIHGGSGYVVSKRAMQVLVKSEISEISEDGWVSSVLGKLFAPENRDDHTYVRRVFKDPLPELPTKKNLLAVVAEFAPVELKQVHRQFVRSDEVDIDKMSAEQYKQHIKSAQSKQENK
jgi:hypothetical protein